jgi:hypothetical protein
MDGMIVSVVSDSSTNDDKDNKSRMAATGIIRRALLSVLGLPDQVSRLRPGSRVT